MCMALKKVVGHVPIELSSNCFLQTHPNNFIIIEITGSRRLAIVLVIPGKFMVFTKSAVIGQKLKRTGNAHKRTLQARGDRNNWN